ncbi:hypothetical protein DH2020_024816 [Rehmannia glutinosa]|uniref:Uncharacterized protein n=1 Tax=Rehmannia glutinosa TaxID=99300 RepID=A0ABR0W1E8_REHGL
MKEFPSCFGENGIQIDHPSLSNTNKTNAQNRVTCVYSYDSFRFSGFITVTWIKHLVAQGLTIGIENPSKQPLCRVHIKPWLFSSKKKGFKNLVVNSTTVNIHWDLSSAKFGSSPEPLQNFYLAIVLNQELCLLLGDSPNEAYKKIDSVSTPVVTKAKFVAKREHIVGKRLYTSKAQFCEKGELHDIWIEYDPSEGFGKCLVICIDRKVVLQVTQLMWKFRGNETILVDGFSVEVYWDVYNWLFGSVNMSNAIFLFRSCVSGEKLWSNVSPNKPSALSWNGWERSKDVDLQQGHGFSLVLCAWKNE